MNFSQFIKSNGISSWPINKSIKPIIDSKVRKIASQMPKEAVASFIANKKIKEILDKLSPFKDTIGIIWDYLIEFDLRKTDDLLSSAKNIRYKWFNLLLILYLYWDNLVKDYIILEWVNPSREDIFLGELLSWITHEWDKEINTLLKLEDYINEIYKTWEANFDVMWKINNKTFLEFLLSTYSYYLQFSASIKWWNLVHNMIYDFLWHLLNNNKLHFDKNIALKLIDKLSNWLPDITFSRWMYMLKKLFEDYDVKEEVINNSVSNALLHYREQLKMAAFR